MNEKKILEQLQSKVDEGVILYDWKDANRILRTFISNNREEIKQCDYTNIVEKLMKWSDTYKQDWKADEEKFSGEPVAQADLELNDVDLAEIDKNKSDSLNKDEDWD